MILWFVLAIMTAAAIFAVLWPLSRKKISSEGGDLAVYRDQLEEIARDRETGLIGDAEADAARVEISRRLLAAADVSSSPGTETPKAALWRRRSAALIALIALPVFACSLYLVLGAPHLPGAPFAARNQTPLEQRSIQSMVAQVESHLERNPADGQGWEVLAPVYLRLGQFQDAVKARRNALQYLGATDARESDLGEALTAAGNGIVTAEARSAFERAVAIDASNSKAQYYLGLAAEQDGRIAEAAKIWISLLSQTAPDAPYRPLIEQSLARVRPSASQEGPSAADVAAAESLPPEQRAQMIQGMVERLAARLKEDGADIDGWLRLVRAYMVLGDRAKAQAAAADARKAAGDDADKRRRLDEFFKVLGIEG